MSKFSDNSPDSRPERRLPAERPFAWRCRRRDEKAKLKIGGTTWTARLLEVSTGGFTVLAHDPKQRLRLGDVGELLSPEGRFAVRVTNAVEVGPDGSTARRNSGTVRLGLERLSEIPARKRMRLEAAMWRSMGRRRWRLPRIAWNVFRVAGVLALVLLPILWVADAQFPDHLLFRQMYSWGKNAVGCGAAAAEKPAGADRAADASATGEDGALPDLVARRLARSCPDRSPLPLPKWPRRCN